MGDATSHLSGTGRHHSRCGSANRDSKRAHGRCGIGIIPTMKGGGGCTTNERRVSVALATYNGARFLEHQLTSIACQTRPPCEIVVCDDGSTDETLQIL